MDKVNRWTGRMEWMGWVSGMRGGERMGCGGRMGVWWKDEVGGSLTFQSPTNA